MQGNTEQKHSTLMLFFPMLFVCVMFEIFRLPEVLDPYRPDLLSLLLIFFVVYDPRRIHMEMAWLSGLIVDLLSGSPLGLNALSLALQVYLIASQFRRFGIFARWQQVIVVGLVNFLGQVFGFWVGHIIGQTAYEANFVDHTLTTALLWVPMALLCAMLCRSFAVAPRKDEQDD